MLRSVLVAAFSAVVAFGTLSGLSGAKGDARADTVWSVPGANAAAGDGDTVVTPNDTVWS
ncbi:hypothetical protein FNH09_11685 [Streptomyces adustus]|uniref:5'-nucleotidase n=1 Tax=Streptomyces adustus TaxID=1609272 RepID=A0A5N8VAK1_9ACTN|nr:hypothetical protein [Streptomyces adustus]MPY31926.1 hypothetical protein [Streptomyces adustus]